MGGSLDFESKSRLLCCHGSQKNKILKIKKLKKAINFMSIVVVKVVHDGTHDAANFPPKMHLKSALIMAQKHSISWLPRMPQT